MRRSLLGPRRGPPPWPGIRGVARCAPTTTLSGGSRRLRRSTDFTGRNRNDQILRPEATLAEGAGHRAIAEEPDDVRTCFERDRDRIVHSTAFRRLAGKTQVVVYPTDHQRTRLTHALEVAQVATSIARSAGLNATLTEAIALGHDCGHGPGGHASEEAFDAFLAEGYEHGPWGADVVLTGLNLCAETLDGIRNHSWSRPAPRTPEGEVVSWADRIAYCAHDLEDAVHAGIVAESDLPADVASVCGRSRRQQLNTFVRAVSALHRRARRDRHASHRSWSLGLTAGVQLPAASTYGLPRWHSRVPWSRSSMRWSSITPSALSAFQERPRCPTTVFGSPSNMSRE